MTVDREAQRREENRERVAEGFGCNPAPDLTHGERLVMKAFARDRIAADNNSTEFAEGWRGSERERFSARHFDPTDDDLYDYEYDGVAA